MNTYAAVDRCRTTRRRVLAAGGGLLGTTLAGCIGGGGGDDDGSGGNASGSDNPDGSADDGQASDSDDDTSFSALASFVMPYDVARQVGGEHVTVEDIVPMGEHGHDWDPDPGVVRDIEDADAFIYTRDFSSWQDDAADELANDDDTTVIEISEGITFIDSPAEDNDEHFWMNPIELQAGVENVVRGFSEMDPDNADTYEENGEAYIEELDALDAEFRDLADRRQQDQVIIGSHDSFQWWWDRYGFDIFSPVGISPDNEASAAEIQEVEELVEEHDVQYILYDMLEPTNLAESLAEETGTEILPLSPIEGITEEMIEDGVETYFDHQREINLETLELALEVE